MRTLSLTLLAAAALAASGCEKTIHEAKFEPARQTTIVEQAPRAVPAVDGVPIA